MKKFFVSQLFRSVLGAAIIVFLALVVVSPLSCRLTEEGIEILPVDTTAPSVEDFSVSGAKSVTISCSEKIVLDCICLLEMEEDDDELLFELLDSGDENLYAVADSISYSENRKSAEIEFSEETKVGKIYVFKGKIYDITGNSLDFVQKFYGYNEKPARLLFNEIRTTYNKSKQAAEYIEFYVLKSGNTFGLELVSGANGESKKYVFPAMEVSQGEFIVVHGRIFDESADIALDELSDDLSLSSAYESSDTARDLWKAGNDKIASNSDVLVLRDSLSLDIKDAVLLSAAGKTEWSKKTMSEFAQTAYDKGIWAGGAGPLNAICTEGMSSSLLRSISRQNRSELAEKYQDTSCLPEYILSAASDWIVTEKMTVDKLVISGATPGYENSRNPYETK
ncbi:MAG: hypothetical protein IJ257_00870 [Treponema sp.]|nr:hypothetical protein [Treponema sp.]